MKAVLNIVAAVLVAAGLVVTVASLLTPGHVILGIDFKLAAILVVGGLILHALASALLLLQRMSHDLRLLRKAGSEEPPWLRQAARSGIQAAAAAAPAAYAAAERAEAVREDDSAEPPEEVGQDIGGPPNVPDETDWPVVSEVQWPDVPEPEGPAEEEAESPFLEPAEPEPRPSRKPWSRPKPRPKRQSSQSRWSLWPSPSRRRATSPSRPKARPKRRSGPSRRSPWPRTCTRRQASPSRTSPGPRRRAGSGRRATQGGHRAVRTARAGTLGSPASA
jgi:hypothetical protein